VFDSTKVQAGEPRMGKSRLGRRRIVGRSLTEFVIRVALGAPPHMAQAWGRATPQSEYGRRGEKP